METIAEEYPDVEFYAWDVDNEAASDSGTIRTAGSDSDNGQSPWVQVYGDQSYIKLAFQYAREYAPEGCLLYYNDYNEYITTKMNYIVSDILEPLIEEDLIDGMGMQSHLDISYPSISLYKTALETYIGLGLDVQITELDATVSDNSDSSFEQQASYYSDLFDLYVEYADNISAVVFWGTTDDQSWRASKYPLLFNEDYTAKPAYYAIVDGLEVVTTATEETTTEETTTTTVEETTTTLEETTTTTAEETTTTLEETTTTTTEETTTTSSTVSDTFLGICGDVNLDGNINLADSIKLNKSIAGVIDLDDNAKINADVNEDNDVDSSDALIMMRFQVGLVLSLPYTD